MGARLSLAALIGAAVLCTTAAQAQDREEVRQMARGKELFTGGVSPACALCHTLAAAGSEGQVGPILDELKPDAQRVLKVLRSGQGVMPSFAGKLSDDDMQAVARFVSVSSGAAPAKP